MSAVSSAAVVEKSSSMERKASDGGGRMSRQQSRREAAVVPVIEDFSKHGGKAYVEQAGKTTLTSPTGTHNLLLFPHDTPIDYERRSHSLQKLRTSVSKIMAANRTSSQFKTLRDQFGVNEIMMSELKTLKVIGEGAFATVEKCLYTPSEWGGQQTKIVAVKKLKPEIVSNEPDLKSFMDEVALMRKLKHKNIVEYVGIGSQNMSTPEARRSTMFLASELMEGGTLKALVMKEMLGAGVSGSLYTLRDAVQWCCQIAEGLAYLHSVQPIVVHRDLKLDNVLLTAAQAFKNGGQPDRSSQIAKLADFGLVAFVKKQTLGAVIDKCTFSMKYQGDDSPFDHEAVQERSKIMISAMSKGGKEKVEYFASMKGDASVKGGAAFSPTDIQVKGLLTGQTGTLMYMAPEMYREEEYDEKVDVFSFGICMYELTHKYMMVFAVSVTGTEEEIMRYAHKVSEGFRPTLREDFPPELKSIIQDSWHENPKKRPSMAEIVKRLQRLLNSNDLNVAGEGPGCCTIS